MTNALTVDPRQTIRWAYTLLLGREPESEETIDRHIRQGGANIETLRHNIFASDEFIASAQQAGLKLAPAGPAVGPLDGMLAETLQARDGFFTDRFGVRTRVNYLPPPYQIYSGKVGSLDGSYDMPLHDVAELNALLRSIAEAKEQFTIMELGAGWGPWIVLGAQLAQRRGLCPILKSVEGSAEHIAFMHSHLADNGLDPSAHHIIHAVAGTYDGVAYFPKLPDPSGDWGAEAKYDTSATSAAEMEEVPCVSLRSLLTGMPPVDFLHCDVQGAEGNVMTVGIEAMNQHVRRTCVGTHGRAIEAKLLDLFAQHGWVLEYEESCRLQQHTGTFALVADGVQVWQNPRLKA